MCRRLMAPLLSVLLTQALPPATSEQRLSRGKQQYKDGLLAEAVATLDTVIAGLDPASAADKPDLIQAFVYKGAALVGLAEETPAKAAFRQAIDLDASFQPSRIDFPDRVLRVFEAARQGKTKSVLQRPNTAPKKAGIGGLGIGLIVGGAALLAGGAAIAAGGGAPSPSPPPPVPSPTPNPNTQVTLISEQVGSVTMRYVNADPAPGSTISGCGPTALGCRPVTVVLRLTASQSVRNPQLSASLATQEQTGVGLASCLYTAVPAFVLNANEPFDIALRFDSPLTPPCGTPATIVRLRADLGNGGERNFVLYRLNYSLHP